MKQKNELKNIRKEDLKSDIRGHINTFTYSKKTLFKVLKILEEE
jgi:hypothetical protein